MDPVTGGLLLLNALLGLGFVAAEADRQARATALELAWERFILVNQGALMARPEGPTTATGPGGARNPMEDFLVFFDRERYRALPPPLAFNEAGVPVKTGALKTAVVNQLESGQGNKGRGGKETEMVAWLGGPLLPPDLDPAVLEEHERLAFEALRELRRRDIDLARVGALLNQANELSKDPEEGISEWERESRGSYVQALREYRAAQVVRTDNMEEHVKTLFRRSPQLRR